MVDDRVVRDVGDEGQGSFGADDQMLDDVDRVAVVHERVERIARGVLDLVFAADAGFQFRIGGDFSRDACDAFQKCRVGAAEVRTGSLVARIQDGSVGQDDADVRHRLVGILGGAATHAAGVVGGDAADHGRVDGGGIGADLAAVPDQIGIGTPAPDTRLQPDLPALVQHFPMLPAVRNEHQHGVADGLAGKRSACGPERDGNIQRVGLVQDGCDFALVPCPDDEFGDHAVKRGVRPVGEGAEGVVKHPLFRYHRKQRFVKALVFSANHKEGNSSLSSETRMSLAMITPLSSNR